VRRGATFPFDRGREKFVSNGGGRDRVSGRSEPRRVSPAQAWRLVEEGRDPVFLDTRNAKHWSQSDVQIRRSLRIWRGELEARIGEVPRGRPVVAYCA
jgi:rhodanese-related sulfurtransferase